MELEKLLKILACPACKGDLAYLNDACQSGFLCENCQVVYPIRDEIPVMLINEAIPLKDWKERCES